MEQGPDLSNLVSARARRVGGARLSNPRNSAGKLSFLAGFPDPASLPRQDIAEATRVALERDGEWALQYGESQGYSGLVEALCAKLRRDQGIDVAPENVLITNGASQALALIVELLVDPGDAVLSEAPTWTGAVHNFNAAGAEIIEIPVDSDGADVDALHATLTGLHAAGRQPKLLYMIPNFQNPKGVTTTLARRQRIVELAATYGLPIVEDDAYFDLRYSGDRLPTMYSMNERGLVMYLGTFSKIMAAGMRLGWVVAPADVILRLSGLKHEGGTSPFAGHVAAEFAMSGMLQEHIAELLPMYKQRRDIMLAGLEAGMPEGASWTTPEGGFFIWLTLPETVTVSDLLPLAAERNVEFLDGRNCYFHGDGAHELRLSYSFATDEQIREGIAILSELVRQQAGA